MRVYDYPILAEPVTDGITLAALVNTFGHEAVVRDLTGIRRETVAFLTTVDVPMVTIGIITP